MIDFQQVLDSGICPFNEWLFTEDNTDISEFLTLEEILESINVN